VVQRQPWPLALCGPHHRPRLAATFAIRFPPRKFMIAAAALTTSQVLRNISSACIQMRLRPDRPAHRHPPHPRHPTNPYRVWLATAAANRDGASQIAGLPVPCPRVARMLHAIMFALFKPCHRQDSNLPTWQPLLGCTTGTFIPRTAGARIQVAMCRATSPRCTTCGSGPNAEKTSPRRAPARRRRFHKALLRIGATLRRSHCFTRAPLHGA
jgi:hypothetical protein